MPLIVTGEMTPRGDQQQAIDKIVANLKNGVKEQILLGVTGSGKTYTMAKCIEGYGKPALVLAHNKTLAAQLFTELRELFPQAAVSYFVSYYDYYQPEAYIPSTDTFIEKDSAINDAIDRLRHRATMELLSRQDVIIVASVSCIYGIGEPESYKNLRIDLLVDETIDRQELLLNLVRIQYERNDYDLYRGSFRVRGNFIEVFPSHEKDLAYRIELFGDEVASLAEVDPLRGKVLREMGAMTIFPNSHYVVDEQRQKQAVTTIRTELGQQLKSLREAGKLLEAERLEQRTLADLEALETTGFCSGIENYSRHLTGRGPGDPPPCLIDYFPNDFVMFIDESHQTLPQLRAMFNGDQARKHTLVDYGFRLPSALDNRPLSFEEFRQRLNQVVYISATPGEYEFNQAGDYVAEQVIRPTGLLDPEIEVRPAQGQIDDLLEQIRQRVAKGQRVLVTTLTKRLAEDITDYYAEVGIRVNYLHSDIKTIERTQLLEQLRRGEFDVLVGINLLREGLDLPEVSLVAILDADKEGFLRSQSSLIQIMGRAARHQDGHVILYADHITESMAGAMEETRRRRRLQEAFNKAHGITPKSIVKAIRSLNVEEMTLGHKSDTYEVELPTEAKAEVIKTLRAQMLAAAKELNFELAAQLRDKIATMEEELDLSPAERFFNKKPADAPKSRKKFTKFSGRSKK